MSEDVRGLLRRVHGWMHAKHHEFQHDYIKDEKKCEDCQLIAEAWAASSSAQPQPPAHEAREEVEAIAAMLETHAVRFEDGPMACDSRVCMECYEPLSYRPHKATCRLVAAIATLRALPSQPAAADALVASHAERFPDAPYNPAALQSSIEAFVRGRPAAADEAVALRRAADERAWAVVDAITLSGEGGLLFDGSDLWRLVDAAKEAEAIVRSARASRAPGEGGK